MTTREEKGGARGWKAALGKERSRPPRRGERRWCNKRWSGGGGRGGGREGGRRRGRYTVSASCVSSVWPRMREASFHCSFLVWVDCSAPLLSSLSLALALSLTRASAHVGRYLHVALLNVISLRFPRSIRERAVSPAALATFDPWQPRSSGSSVNLMNVFPKRGHT